MGANCTNLYRIQIVKGRVKDGKTVEKIYNIALSDDRKAYAYGKVPPVGYAVNVMKSRYSNAIGAPYLEAHRKNPAFNPAEHAFYYVRVLEIPTPRWTTYNSKIVGVKLPDEVSASIQERAYTSLIWYTP